MNNQTPDIFSPEVPGMDQISNYFTVTGLPVSALSFPVALSYSQSKVSYVRNCEKNIGPP